MPPLRQNQKCNPERVKWSLVQIHDHQTGMLPSKWPLICRKTSPASAKQCRLITFVYHSVTFNIMQFCFMVIISLDVVAQIACGWGTGNKHITSQGLTLVHVLSIHNYLSIQGSVYQWVLFHWKPVFLYPLSSGVKLS